MEYDSMGDTQQSKREERKFLLRILLGLLWI